MERRNQQQEKNLEQLVEILAEVKIRKNWVEPVEE
jgi:hypothetical protein